MSLSISHESIVVRLLKKMFNHGDTLSWWIYELDYGRKYTDGCIVGQNGTNIDVSTAEKLYDYLVNNRSDEPAHYGVGLYFAAIESILKERQADKEKKKELEEIKERYLKLESDRFWDNVIPKSLIEEEINRLKYDVSKIKEIKQTRYSDYDRIRLSAYVTKSNEIIKRLEKCVKNDKSH